MANIGDITGSASDVISVGLALSDAMAPDKGFAYNLCAFEIDLRTDSTGPQSAGLAGTTPPARSPRPSLLPGRTGAGTKLQARPGPVIFAVRTGSHGELGGIRTVLELGIQELASPGGIIGIVELRKLEGFDDAISDTLMVEVTAQPVTTVAHGVLLVIKGLINPTGIGFAHFIGAVLVRAESQGSSSLVAEPQFITQTPPASEGLGIFGKVIQTGKTRTYLELWTYFGPLGG